MSHLRGVGEVSLGPQRTDGKLHPAVTLVKDRIASDLDVAAVAGLWARLEERAKSCSGIRVAALREHLGAAIGLASIAICSKRHSAYMRRTPPEQCGHGTHSSGECSLRRSGCSRPRMCRHPCSRRSPPVEGLPTGRLPAVQRIAPRGAAQGGRRS